MTYVPATYLHTSPKVSAVVTLPVLEAQFRALGKRLAFIVAAIGVLAALLATDVSADPAADALVELTELSRLAEQTTEQIHPPKSTSTRSSPPSRSRRKRRPLIA